jgi:hypothetical protein
VLTLERLAAGVGLVLPCALPVVAQQDLQVALGDPDLVAQPLGLVGELRLDGFQLLGGPGRLVRPNGKGGR